ncbi:MAG: histidinol-phosphatase HisJ family protein [Clostridia bacterium]|nr:histidinol-phosphatase HisJ family protein [Clostridia bacterium]
MIPSNYHTHTRYCDGRDTPEELIQEAIRLGCPEIGFSGHAYTPFDRSYCMSKKKTELYNAEIPRLKEKYKDRIRVLFGIEQDYFSPMPTERYDYVIGAVHYIEKDGKYLPIDGSRKRQIADVKKYYDGDFYAYCEDYYRLVADLYEKTRCDIVAHFDLVTKFNEAGDLFDTKNPRYVAAADAAIGALLRCPVAFEVNYGAVARGYRQTPYPERRILATLRAAGVKTITTSDCHDKQYLLFGLQ